MADNKKKAPAPTALKSKDGFDRTDLEDLLKRRFFYTTAFGIYGGVRGLYDYGPPGCSVKNNLIQFWRQHFVMEESMLEIETTSITPEIVLKTSGHVEKFDDAMVKDVVTGECYRADHLLEDLIDKAFEKPGLTADEKAAMELDKNQADAFSLEILGQKLKHYGAKAPDSGNDVSDPFKFNLMFPTPIGPSGLLKGYLRPETAQGIFVNFKRLLDYNGGKLPFAGAQIGPAFRNEISPRAGLLRVREFTLAEIEHFVDPVDKSHPKFESVADTELTLFPRTNQVGDNKHVKMTAGEAVKTGVIGNETLAYFMARTQTFLLLVGIKAHKLRFRQHLSDEMAHYAGDCWDAEIETSYGWIECVGHADRSCYDLTRHSEISGEALSAFVDFKDGPKVVNVIECLPNKGAIGKTLKGAAKPALEEIEKNKANQTKIAAWAAEYEKEGKVVIAGVELSKELITFKTVQQKVSGAPILPAVIEPSFGIGRILYCIFEHSFNRRAVVKQGVEPKQFLSFSPVIAPLKCTILPLMVKPELTAFVPRIAKLLANRGISYKMDDSSATIGKKYARTDEIGIPFGITIDPKTIAEDTVTLRDRDSTEQVRIPIDQLADAIQSIIFGECLWKDIAAKFPKEDRVDDE